jgi:hypothetical protein
MNETSINVLYGGATQPLHLQSAEQLKASSQEKIKRVKEKAFMRGLPIIWGANGKVIAEYANGSKFLVIDGTISSIAYED